MVSYARTAGCPLFGLDSTGSPLVDQLDLEDNQYLVFGTGRDVLAHWDGTNLIIAPLADDALIEIGDAAATSAQKSFDLKWYGGVGTGGSYLYADASANLIYTTGVDLQFKDNDLLVFGTGAGATGDVQMKWDGTNLLITPTADDAIIEFGDAAATQLSWDIKIYGNASNGADYAVFDAGNSRLDMAGAYALGYHRRVVSAKTTAYTVTSAESGTIFTTQGAGNAVTFMLPDDMVVGLNYMFVNAEEQTMAVTVHTNDQDKMIVSNDLAADTITFDQAGYDVGAGCFVFNDGTFWNVLPWTGHKSNVSNADATYFTVAT